MVRVPVTPAWRFDQYVGKSFPIGMTAPMPVITARRAGSRSGTDHRGGVGHGADCTDDAADGSVPVIPPEDHRTVVATETDVVRERIPDGAGLRLRGDVDVALGVDVPEVDGAGRTLLGNGQDRR